MAAAYAKATNAAVNAALSVTLPNELQRSEG